MIRILFIDDDPEHLEIASQNLLRLTDDLDIEMAGSPEEGLLSLSGRRYDCVICDYQMPNIDGLELLRSIRGMGNDVPFILYTGQGSDEVAKQACRAGVSFYYTKELDDGHFQNLLKGIRNAVMSEP